MIEQALTIRCVETPAPRLLRRTLFKMKNGIKTIIGAAGLISLGAVGISYFDESIERRTMDGMEGFVTTFASYPGPANFAGRSDLVARQSRIMEAVEYLAANGIDTVSNLTVTGEFTLANTVWDDTAVPALSFRTGITAPSLDVWEGTIYAFSFQPSTVNDQVFLSVQLSHRYKEGTALYPHVHWGIIEAPSAPALTNVVFGLDYTVVQVDGTWGSPQTLLTTNYITGLKAHTISAFQRIVNTNLGISSVLLGRLYRVGTSAADTYDKSLFIHSFDLHYEADTLGTFTEYEK